MAKTLNKDCPCDYPCDRHGDCEACQAYHANDRTTCQRLGKKDK